MDRMAFVTAVVLIGLAALLVGWAVIAVLAAAAGR
jgi:hypothetical protein